MPVIPITAASLTLPSGVAIVGAVMLFQGDEKRRTEYQSAAVKEWSLAKAKKHGLPIDADGARRLQTHPTAEDGQAMIREPYRRGAAAAEALLRMLEGGKMRDAKVGAIEELAQVYHGSLRTFDNADWPAFKPVSHLWAVHIERVRYGLGLDYFPCPPAALRGFLAAAEALLAMATATKPHQSRYGSILDSDAAWRVPAKLKLPTVSRA